MKVKVLLIATMLAAGSSVSSWATSERIYCPPISALHCDGMGHCTLDSAYEAYWGAMDVNGMPGENLIFGGVDMSGATDCEYGTSYGNYVSIYAKHTMVRDMSIPNHWDGSYGFWMCDMINGGQVEDCPMLVS